MGHATEEEMLKKIKDEFPDLSDEKARRKARKEDIALRYINYTEFASELRKGTKEKRDKNQLKIELKQILEYADKRDALKTIGTHTLMPWAIDAFVELAIKEPRKVLRIILHETIEDLIGSYIDSNKFLQKPFRKLPHILAMFLLFPVLELITRGTLGLKNR